LKKKNVFIVYFSPAGSTRHVAEVIEKRFMALGAKVSLFDLAVIWQRIRDRAAFFRKSLVHKYSCLLTKGCKNETES
jgi:menaquinone-dependent protoporphyrinogen IX oxidase